MLMPALTGHDEYIGSTTPHDATLVVKCVNWAEPLNPTEGKMQSIDEYGDQGDQRKAAVRPTGGSSLVPSKPLDPTAFPSTKSACQARTRSIDASIVVSRRQMRYSSSMKTLISAFQKCDAEASQRELQIRSLERAMDVLSARARDAHERAANLRARIASRDLDLDPTEHRSLQAEYWMAQKCSSLREKQLQDAQSNLNSLRANPTEDWSFRAENRPGFRHQARRKANLVMFLNSTSTMIPLSRHSMLSRPTAITYPSSTRMRYMHFRTPSRPSTLTPSLDKALYPKEFISHNAGIASDNVTVETDSSSTSGDQSMADGAPKVDEPLPSAVALTSNPVGRPVSKFDQGGYGMVTIYDSDAIRTRETILADLDDVALPGYAHELLNELGHPNANVLLDFPRITEVWSVYSDIHAMQPSPGELSNARHRSQSPQTSAQQSNHATSTIPDRLELNLPLQSPHIKRFSLTSFKDHVSVLSKVRKRISVLGHK